jgi:hypothetical protein
VTVACKRAQTSCPVFLIASAPAWRAGASAASVHGRAHSVCGAADLDVQLRARRRRQRGRAALLVHAPEHAVQRRQRGVAVVAGAKAGDLGELRLYRFVARPIGRDAARGAAARQQQRRQPRADPPLETREMMHPIRVTEAPAAVDGQKRKFAPSVA